METIHPQAIREAFQARGVTLNPPATEDAIARLLSWAGGNLHSYFVQMLREFDGFSNWDFEEKSFVSVWSIEKALSHDWTQPPMLAFSDWSLNAMVFGFDPSSNGPIISIEDARIVAPTYAEFWPRLLSDSLF
jgi:hypothetical protein